MRQFIQFFSTIIFSFILIQTIACKGGSSEEEPRKLEDPLENLQESVPAEAPENALLKSWQIQITEDEKDCGSVPNFNSSVWVVKDDGTCELESNGTTGFSSGPSGTSEFLCFAGGTQVAAGTTSTSGNNDCEIEVVNEYHLELNDDGKLEGTGTGTTTYSEGCFDVMDLPEEARDGCELTMTVLGEEYVADDPDDDPDSNDDGDDDDGNDDDGNDDDDNENPDDTDGDGLVNSIDPKPNQTNQWGVVLHSGPYLIDGAYQGCFPPDQNLQSNHLVGSINGDGDLVINGETIDTSLATLPTYNNCSIGGPFDWENGIYYID